MSVCVFVNQVNLVLALVGKNLSNKVAWESEVKTSIGTRAMVTMVRMRLKGWCE